MSLKLIFMTNNNIIIKNLAFIEYVILSITMQTYNTPQYGIYTQNYYWFIRLKNCEIT